MTDNKKPRRKAGLGKEVNKVKIEIIGEPKEIAALVLVVQERQLDRISEIDEQLGLRVSRQTEEGSIP